MVVVYEYCDHCFTDCPAVNALKTRESEWIKIGEMYSCKGCMCLSFRQSLYCPECGRKMKNGETVSGTYHPEESMFTEFDDLTDPSVEGF